MLLLSQAELEKLINQYYELLSKARWFRRQDENKQAMEYYRMAHRLLNEMKRPFISPKGKVYK